MPLIKMTYAAAQELGEHLQNLTPSGSHAIASVEIGSSVPSDAITDEVTVYVNLSSETVGGDTGITRPSEGECK